MMHIMNIMNIMISGYESLYTHLHGSDIFSSWKVWSQFRSRPGLQICRCLASDLEGRDFVEIYHSWGIPPPFDWVYFSESILSTFTVICDEDVFRVAGTQWLQCGLCCAQLRRFGEDWSTFERFFFFSWILLCHGMREAVLFFVCNLIVWICPAVSCIFVLVPWWVVRWIRFFSVFLYKSVANVWMMWGIFFMSWRQKLTWYSGCKKSCRTWDISNPVNSCINCQPSTGTGLFSLKSTSIIYRNTVDGRTPVPVDR